MIGSIREGSMLHEVTRGIICQQVNCRGKMGSGIALAIMTRWPVVETAYAACCKQAAGNGGADRLLGSMLPVQVDEQLWICNLFGQLTYGRDPAGQRYGRYTGYDALDAAARRVADFALSLDPVPTVNYPEIGCGLGGGDWAVVSAILNARFGSVDHCHWKYR